MNPPMRRVNLALMEARTHPIRTTLTPPQSAPRKPKPSPVGITAKLESFDLLPADFSDDSGLKDYVILPSRNRATEFEAPTFYDSRIQDKKKGDNRTVAGGV